MSREGDKSVRFYERHGEHHEVAKSTHRTTCELPASMSAPDWQIAIPTGNLVTTYRGIRIVIKLGENGNPLEIGWYIGGQVEESVPLSCDLEWAKRLAVDVIDERIPEDEVWRQAEKGSRIRSQSIEV
jgi:hypothetical protein